MGEFLEHLDLSQVPHGLLLDQSFQIADLSLFDGTQDSVYATSGLLRRIYDTLMGAAVSPVSQLPDYNATLGPLSESDTLPLKALLFSYGAFKEHAVDDNLLSISNNQLYDVANRPESPYLSKTLLAASPWRDGKSFAPGNYSFTFELTTNWGPTEYSAAVDFDDGQGFQSITSGSTQNVTYTVAGEKRLKVRIIERGGDTLYSYSRIQVEAPTAQSPVSPTDVGNYCPGQQFQIPNIDGAQVNYFTACCIDPRIKKPLIVLDGFEAMGLEGLFPEFDINGLIRQLISFTNFPGQTGNNLLTDLENSRYDIIFVDFDNAGAALEVNAEVVRNVIREVNARKAAAGSTEENVVLGISMGGLLGPLALLGMEETGEEHETELMISFDAPLRGANIPLAYQALVTHLSLLLIDEDPLDNPFTAGVPLTEFIPELGEAIATLNSASARQMLMYHIADEPDDPSSPYRTFYESFSTMGLNGDGKLVDAKHIAIANGSQLSLSQGFSGGDNLFDVDASINDILQNLEELNLGNSNFSDFWSTVVEVIAFITTTRVKVDFAGFSIAGQGTQTIYRGRITAIVFGVEIIIQPPLKYEVPDDPNIWPIDNAPGGFADVNPNELEGELNLDIEDLDFINLPVRQFCFIPTVSALGIGPFQGSNATLSDPFESISNNADILARSIANEVVAYNEDAPNPLDDNLEHVDFHPDNAGVIRMNLLEVPGGFTLLTGNDFYNFGDSGQEFDYQSATPTFVLKATTNTIDENLTITNSGRMLVNVFDRIAFTTNLANPFNQSVSHFDVFITRGFCDNNPVTVTIQNDSRMVIGEWNAGAGVQNTGDVYVQADATVDIQQDGQVEVNKASEYIVQDGGRTFVRGGGLLEARFGGAIRIEDGGEVIVESDATLRISQESALTVEPGGRLVIADGAKIQLWDGADPFGRAVLEVQGELEIQGSFEFTGNGFFDFFQGHTLSLPGGSLRIEGRGFGKRFLRLQQNADLDIGSADLVLEKGLAEFFSGSRIKVGPGGSAVVVEMDMAGSGGMSALWMEQSNTLRVLDSRMQGFEAAILGDGLFPANSFDLWLVNTDFANNSFSVLLEDSGLLRAWDCNFDGTQGGIGLALSNVEGARLQNCDIHHFTGNDSSPEDNTASVGIFVENVEELLMTGGKLRDNDIGLYCPAGFRANVILRGQAEVANNAAYGIFIEQGQLSSTDAYGMVTMDCAKLLNNGLAGIKGQDITLNIDAYINSQTNDPNFVRANHFQRNVATTGLWFDICYTSPLGQAIQTIPARGNYWGSDNANPTPGNGVFYYALDRAGTGCGGTPEISLNTSLKATAAPNSCPSGPVTGPEVPLDLLCGVYAERNIRVDEDMVAALSTYFDKLDNDEETQSTHALFDIVAGVSDTVRNGASQDCRHLIDVARIFSTGQAGGGSAGRGATAALAKVAGGLSVFPNPASSQARLIAPYPGNFSLQVFNANGQSVAQGFFESDMTNISTKDWPEGIYYIRVSDKAARKDWGATLLIQR